MCECARKLPCADFVYFADNRNMPYGLLPQQKILKLTTEIFERIASLNPLAAVIACNTVTARCAKELRSKFSFPIIGIQPAIKPASLAGGKSVVLATPSTAASEALKELVEKYGNGQAEIIPCPDLASYVENNIFNLDEEKIFSMLPEIKAENVVLGCTHYIFIKEIIKRRYVRRIFDGVEGTARRLCDVVGNAVSADNTQRKITFSGGDEGKNKRVFELLTASERGFGEIFPKKSQ